MTSPAPSPERTRTSSEEQLREREEEVVMAPDDGEDGRRLSHGGYHQPVPLDRLLDREE